MTVTTVNDTFSYSLTDNVHAFHNYVFAARMAQAKGMAESVVSFWTEKATIAFRNRHQ